MLILFDDENMKSDLEEYLNKEIVIDSNSSWIYIGVLEKVTENCVVLSNADAHDNNFIDHFDVPPG